MVEPNKAVFNKLAAKKQLERDQQLRSVVDDTIIPYFTRAIVRDVDTVGGQLDGINPINSIVADIVELSYLMVLHIFVLYCVIYKMSVCDYIPEFMVIFPICPFFDRGK